MTPAIIAIENHDPADLLDAITSALRNGETTWLTESGQLRALITPAGGNGQEPARTVILPLTTAEYEAITVGLDTLSPDGDSVEVVARTMALVSAAWAAAGKHDRIIPPQTSAEPAGQPGTPSAPARAEQAAPATKESDRQ